MRQTCQLKEHVIRQTHTLSLSYRSFFRAPSPRTKFLTSAYCSTWTPRRPLGIVPHTRDDDEKDEDDADLTIHCKELPNNDLDLVIHTRRKATDRTIIVDVDQHFNTRHHPAVQTLDLPHDPFHNQSLGFSRGASNQRPVGLSFMDGRTDSACQSVLVLNFLRVAFFFSLFSAVLVPPRDVRLFLFGCVSSPLFVCR